MNHLESHTSPESFDFTEKPLLLTTSSLKELIKDVGFYRFVRVGDDVYFSDTDFDHRDIIVEFNIKIEDINDAGFFKVMYRKIKIEETSAFVEIKGIHSNQQLANRPETVVAFKSKLEDLDVDF